MLAWYRLSTDLALAVLRPTTVLVILDIQRSVYDPALNRVTHRDATAGCDAILTLVIVQTPR